MNIETAGDLLRFLEAHPEYLSHKLYLDSAELMCSARISILSVDADEFGDEVLWLYAPMEETHRLRKACTRALSHITDPALREELTNAIEGRKPE